MDSIDESSNRWALLNPLCDRFEDAWQSGKDPRVEEYLSEVPARWVAEAQRELITLDQHYRRRTGLLDEAAGYLERFPDLDRLWLQQLLAAKGSIGSNAGDASASGLLRKHGARLRPVLPGFEVLEILGRGGMGVVYKARQLDLNRLVAIKMILAGDLASAEAIARFRAEARAVAQLQHPNLVQIFEVGEFESRLYLTFEYVPGGSLDKRLNGVPQLPRPSVRLVRELSRATQFAHNRSIVHRDLKPANVLLAVETPSEPSSGQAASVVRHSSPVESAVGRETGPPGRDLSSIDVAVDFGQPKIADFGLAKQLGTEDSHTLTGAVLGSPSYMAPEQAAGDPGQVGPAADVYALGAILYEMLTGRPPFRGATVADTLNQVRNNEPISLRRLQPSIHRDLETICLKCLQKEPAQRYESAGALADDLDRFLRDEPVLARPVSRTERTYRWCRRHPMVALLIILLAFVTTAGIAGIGWHWREANRQRDLADTNADRYRTERDFADGQRELAERNRAAAERKSYFHSIGQAFGEWEGNQVGRAIQRLEDCPVELRGWEWRYLQSMFRQEMKTLAGHSDEVSCVSSSPDGRTIVSGSGVFGWKRPGEIILWDAETGEQKRKLDGHGGPIMEIAWAANGLKFVTSAAGFENGGPGLVKLWSRSGDPLLTLPRPGLDAWAVAISPDGKLLATGGLEPIVLLWDAETGQLLKKLQGHKSNIFGLAFSPDGRVLASVGNDGIARTWTVETGFAGAISLTGLGPLRNVVFSPDGRFLAMSNYGNDLYIQDLADPAEAPRHIYCRCRPISAVTYSPEGRRIVVSGYDGQVLFLDPLTGRQIGFVATHNGAVNNVTIDSKARLVTAGMDRLVKIWDTWTEGISRETNFSQQARRGTFRQVVFTPDGSHLLMANGVNQTAAGSGSNDLLVWNLEGRRVSHVLSGHTSWLTSVAVTSDGAWYATGSADRTVRLWNAMSGTSIRELRGHLAEVTSVSFSSDGLRLASGSIDAAIRVWDRGSGTLLHEFRASGGGVKRLVFAPGGRRLAVACENGVIDLFDAESGKLVQTLRGHTGAVAAIAFSHAGKFLASAGEDQLVRVWDGPTGRLLHELKGHTAGVADLAFSPDDGRLGTVGADHLIKLWDPEHGDEAYTIYSSDKLATIAFHPDGEGFVVTSKYIMTSFSTRPTMSDAEKQAAYDAANLQWHRTQSKECLERKQLFATEFHCDRWAALEPESAELSSVRNQVNELRESLEN